VRVTAFDLPGHGDDPGPFTDLHGDAAAVSTVLDGLSDVLLVGHSYGGAVITEAGVHPAVRHLVYLAGLALDRGETCQAAAVAESSGLSYEGRPDLGACLQVHEDGTSSLLPAAADCLYQDCTAPDAAWAMARLGPQPMLNLAQEPHAVAWLDTSATYLVCADDRTVHPDLQRILARRCSSSQEWPTGHSPFLSQPARVVDLLLSLV
jgi:pimeloyl-ACP methyl ester carboxylesterase